MINQDMEVEAYYVELWRWQPKENNRWNRGLGSKIKKGEGRVQDSCFAMMSPLDYLIFN